MSLCKYSNIFGKPKEGVHKHRFLGFASVDLFATLLVSYLISLKIKKSIIYIFLILIIISIIVHRIFCVNTTLTSLIFKCCNEEPQNHQLQEES